MLKITSNYHKRKILNSWDLTKKELEDFDYLSINIDPSEAGSWHHKRYDDAGEITGHYDIDGSFFRYQGCVYDLGNFMRMHSESRILYDPFSIFHRTTSTGWGLAVRELATWDGYCSESHSFGIVVRYSEDCESVVVGRYCS